jgi:hypothetical protein
MRIFTGEAGSFASVVGCTATFDDTGDDLKNGC